MKAVTELIKELTIEEKIALVSGTNFMYTNPIPRLGIPSIRMSDGPHGLRVQNSSGDNGVNGSEVATCFPPASLSSCSWNKELLLKEGKAMGEEALHYGIDVILGPGNNIKRNPLGGRNFEYFSEDPFLSGNMAGSIIKGIQNTSVSVSLKHFATNNQENYRFMGDSIVDKRALNEIYLKSFEIALKEGNPDTLMCSYNKINGTYACENKMLLTDTLRTKWGFKGLVMTDWGASHNRLKMLESGLDLEMPGDTSICRKWIYDAIKDGTLDISILDKAVTNVLNLVSKHSNKKEYKADFESHSKLSQEIALDSAVLLKNNDVLPLNKDKKYLVVGELFEHMRYQGAGSSMINPYKLITPKMAFDEGNIKYTYLKGYKENKLESDEMLLKEVDDNISQYDTVLVFIGLTDYVEFEGGDRTTFLLPKNQEELVNHVVNKSKKVILVMFGGSPYLIPHLNQVDGILNMYLPGQEGGNALKKLLFGEANPCGKLSESWPLNYEDVSNYLTYSKDRIEVYKESIYVGYRYYQKANKKVAFPFGYGLSYTKFKYDNLILKQEQDKIDISFDVTNMGQYAGGEISQVYVKAPRSNIDKPLKELKGFSKVYLKPNETKNVNIIIKKEDLRYFNIKEDRFVLEDGEYNFEVSSNSEKAELQQSIYIKGETLEDIYPSNILELDEKDYASKLNLVIPKVKLKPITLDSRFSDLKQTFMGRIIYKAVINVAYKDMKKALKMPEGPEKDNKIKGAMFLEKILDSNSIICMSMSAGKQFKYNFALGMMDLSNGHIFKGIKDFCSKIDAPLLPNNKK